MGHVAKEAINKTINHAISAIWWGPQSGARVSEHRAKLKLTGVKRMRKIRLHAVSGVSTSGLHDFHMLAHFGVACVLNCFMDWLN